MPMTSGLFITGVGTEVGKTHVGAMIARELARAGVRVGVYKPAASGCRREGDELISDDAVELWEAAGRPRTLEEVCPQRFVAPVAPPRAALEEGGRVDPELLRSGLQPWADSCDVVLVEGAGGLMSPLSDADYNVDLARDLGLPMLVVAANELGVINATLQTLITAEARAGGIPIAGVVLNQAQRLADDASLASNADELRRRASAPLLACVGYGECRFAESVDWLAVVRG
ncbi:dethiobiotin synthase [Pirellulales bacterium]|nr:dethiobiotin synthase [Pirellulales bacterium]